MNNAQRISLKLFGLLIILAIFLNAYSIYAFIYNNWRFENTSNDHDRPPAMPSWSINALGQLTESNCEYKNNISLISNCSIVVSPGSCTVRQEIQKLNKILQTIRDDVLRIQKQQNPNKTRRQGLSEQRGHFTKSKVGRTNVTVIRMDSEYLGGQYLNWSVWGPIDDIRSVELKYHTNAQFGQLLEEKFYTPTMDHKSCELSRRQRVVNYCSKFTSIKATIRPASTDSSNFLRRDNIHVFVIPGGGRIDGITGGVRTREYFLISNQCLMQSYAKSAMMSNKPDPSEKSFKEVFVISQYWGQGYFHSLIENMPRIALYVEFLAANPNIRIHVRTSMKTKDFIRLYRLNPDRVVTGNVRADVIYLPQGGNCAKFNPCFICLRVMAETFAKVSAQPNQTNFGLLDLRRSIQKKNRSERSADYIIQITRSHRRFLRPKSSKIVEKILTKFANKFNLTYVKFPDRPVPSMQRTLDVFRRAVLVFAPHGAGLSNLVFSPRGTFVIEVLSRDQINLCYMTLCHNLGHRWHGILSSSPNPALSVNLKYLNNVVRFFLSNRYA